MYSYSLSFKLNKYQLLASNLILKYYLGNKNILLDAVCGAGKTEMLLEVILYALNNNKRICFASPRKQLCNDLYKRYALYFNTLLFGLHTSDHHINKDSQLLFCTTHQLVKYPNSFDLLIIDEIDAFPYLDNYELEQASLNASKQFIFLSATVPNKYYDLVNRNKLMLISNNFRHHLKAMPIPILKKYTFLIYNLLKYAYKYRNKKLLIFVPSIKLGYKIYYFLRLFKYNINYIYGSKISNKIIDDFKNNKLNILISTTVLERGMTFNKVDVLVVNANSKIFDTACLIQICGRVGRDTINHTGNIYFLANQINNNMIKTKERIIEYNEMYDMS